MTEDQLTDALTRLSENEKVQVVEILLFSLSGSQDEILKVHLEEEKRRLSSHIENNSPPSFIDEAINIVMK